MLVDSIPARVTPDSSSQPVSTASERVIVGNVRVSLWRRPRGPGVRTHTVTVFLPMSSPWARFWPNALHAVRAQVCETASGRGGADITDRSR
ncbi:hypothetical protein GCM10027053_26020 [Intrasporangium mesophilum]